MQKTYREKIRWLLKYCSEYDGHEYMYDEHVREDRFDISLHIEKDILECMKTARIVVLTGDAGDGKSRVLNRIQPVKVGKHYYMDGALADSVPFLRAVEKGCDKNIVILTREKGYRKKPGHSLKMVSRIYQSYPNLVDALKHRAENYNLCRRKG